MSRDSSIIKLGSSRPPNLLDLDANAPNAGVE